MLASAVRHGGSEGLWTWTWDPSILIGLVFWVVAYMLVTGPAGRSWGLGQVSFGKRICFYLGTLLVFIALVSPLDHLADEYLFSAHMLQHMLLMMVAPPLWLIGLPEGLVDRLVPRRIQPATRLLATPVAAFILYNVVLWGWHIPSLYDAALENENIHIVEHLFFMVAGVIAWWPLLGKSQKAAPPAALSAQMLYLFLMMFPMTLLAALITFAKYPVYPFYVDAPRLWGLSVMDDQQAGGLLMWIPGNMIYFIPFAISFFRWFDQQNAAEDREFPPELDQTAGDIPPAPKPARVKS